MSRLVNWHATAMKASIMQHQVPRVDRGCCRTQGLEALQTDAMKISNMKLQVPRDDRGCCRAQGLEALQAELRLDVRRLWQRNLGRDDRLIADHGRESRHPFLDKGFMATILDLPLPVVADLNNPGKNFWGFLLPASLHSLSSAKLDLPLPVVAKLNNPGKKSWDPCFLSSAYYRHTEIGVDYSRWVEPQRACPGRVLEAWLPAGVFLVFLPKMAYGMAQSLVQRFS